MKIMIACIALAAFILLALGCHNQMSSEELQAMQNDCKQNIFHELVFMSTYEDRQKPLAVQHMQDGKIIEEFTFSSKDGIHRTKKLIYGNDTYLLKIDNKVYALTELRGEYNPRCTMFGCYPACDINGYKINNQKKRGATIYLE